MNLMQRRRALMEQKPSDVLYRLENYTFNMESINTGLRLFGIDQDWSIALDANLTTNPTSGTASSWRLVGSWSSAIGGWNINLGKGNATVKTMAIVYMDTGNNYVSVDGISVGAGRYRFVITHAENSGSATLMIRKNSEAVRTFSKSNTFVSSTSQLYIGMPQDANKLPEGTINKAIVYNRALSVSEINAFLGI